MVWKSDFFRGSMRFVRVPPYESGVKLTNFVFSWQNGEFWWGQKCCTPLLTQNEELSKKIGAYILIYNCVYANTWQGGQICPPPPWIGLNQNFPFDDERNSHRECTHSLLCHRHKTREETQSPKVQFETSKLQLLHYLFGLLRLRLQLIMTCTSLQTLTCKKLSGEPASYIIINCYACYLYKVSK